MNRTVIDRTPPDSPDTDWRNRKVTVMGLGTFGGGTGVVKYLVRAGAIVTVTDLRSPEELQVSLNELQATPPAQLVLGRHREQDFSEADCIVVNPAVPCTSPFLTIARSAGVPLTSEMRLFWERNPAPVVGITGSNGKSTTTALTAALLQAAGEKVWLGGNIGRSLLPELHHIHPSDWVVLELSSFQLEDLAILSPRPQVAIITNFTPNHLDRHGTLESYRSAKQSLLNHQNPDQIAVLNSDDPDVRTWSTPARRIFFGTTQRDEEGLYLDTHSGSVAIARFSGHEWKFPIRDWLKLPGRHNVMNALAASAATLALKFPAEAIESGLKNFNALPHRLELVHECAGRRFFNDSLATTPESTQHAIAAFSQPILLLAGGYDKGSNLADMAQAIAQKPVKAVALMGTTGPTLGELISRHDPQGDIPQQICSNFSEAFHWTMQRSAPGDVILLSPGCASYDWFKNFVERGEKFSQLARNWHPPSA